MPHKLIAELKLAVSKGAPATISSDTQIAVTANSIRVKSGMVSHEGEER